MQTLARRLVYPLCILLSLAENRLHAQLPGDCIDALPITSIHFDMPVYGVVENNVPDEINPLTSCVSNGEDGIWHEILILDSGILHFNIVPYVENNDYDWALFDLTNHACTDIYPVDSLLIRCNFSSSVSHNGATGANGGSDLQDEEVVQAYAGQRFVLYISNFSESTDGYQSDLSGSSCTFNTIIGLPRIQPVADNVAFFPNPNSGEFTITTTENANSCKVKITDLQGRTVHFSSLSPGNQWNMMISGIPAGEYIISIYTGCNAYHRKLIIVQ